MRMAGTIRRTIIGQGFILVALMFDLETLWRDENEVIYYSTSASLRRTRERDIVACFFFHPTSSSACMSSKQERAKEQSLDEMRSTSFMTQLSHSLKSLREFLPLYNLQCLRLLPRTKIFLSHITSFSQFDLNSFCRVYFPKTRISLLLFGISAKEKIA